MNRQHSQAVSDTCLRQVHYHDPYKTAAVHNINSKSGLGGLDGGKVHGMAGVQTGEEDREFEGRRRVYVEESEETRVPF